MFYRYRPKKLEYLVVFQTNLAAPVYLVNVTHIVGAVNPIVSQPGIITIGTATVSSFQTAPKD